MTPAAVLADLLDAWRADIDSTPIPDWTSGRCYATPDRCV